MFGWSDFVVLCKFGSVCLVEMIDRNMMIVFDVLVRFNALSRAIESALQKEGISSRVLGGHKFFERAEVRSRLFKALIYCVVYRSHETNIVFRSRTFWHTCK
jgi:superfamily I DNA/RNA helicase